MRQLTEEERDVLFMTYYGGCSYRETALLLDRPEAAVKSQLRAALRRLEAALKMG